MAKERIFHAKLRAVTMKDRRTKRNHTRQQQKAKLKKECY